MKIHKGYKYRLKTNRPAQRSFVSFAGACRFVWNKIVALNEGRYLAGMPRLSYHDAAGLLTLWKQSEEYGWLNTIHSQVLQQCLIDLERAYTNLVMQDVSAERGEFVPFRLFLREETLDKWDLVISAPWIEADKLKALREFVKKATPIVGDQGLLALSRIMTLSPDDPNLDALLQTVQVDNGPLELWHPDFFGLDIKHAYILRAKRSIQPAPSAT